LKEKENQKLKGREPRQKRAQHKVELILEAAMRLLDKGGFELLTTNAIAETAGVSIGTLYQYFPNKESILDALSGREVAELSERVIQALQNPALTSPRERIGHILRAVTSAYGERRRVHRLVIEYSFARGSNRIAPLIDRIVALLKSRDKTPLSEAEAFVLTNAFVGVMEATLLRPDLNSPKEAEIEDALARLVLGFVAPRPEA